MSDIFISYARSTASQAQAVAEALRVLGYDVWRDDELPAHRAYAEVIEERLRSARAVVVIWSAEAAKSQWVRAEANVAREAGTLVQLRLDGAVPPLPFNEIQCADMNGWVGDLDAHGWKKVVASVAELMGGSAAKPAPGPVARKLSICVLPFANMSGEAEQEYFSDGISEDIITDLSKVSALSVVARNTAFTFKGKSSRIPEIAKELNVSHVLEGSVRKAGGRVRITAQLIDGAAGDHVWAERYDRDLTDIFALQDEISEAIVRALKLKLLPEERKAIEQRGTDSVEAYDIYLMARRQRSSGNEGDPRLYETVIHLCQRAIDIDPAYARAWAMMAVAQSNLRTSHGRSEIDPWPAVETALALDPNLAEGHAAKAGCLRMEGRADDALVEAEIALRLDPESPSATLAAANVYYRLGRFGDAAPLYEKSAALSETDFAASTLVLSCYTVLGDGEGALRAARLTLKGAETALERDVANGSALAYGACALAALGEGDRAREWVRRALLMDPDNQLMRYNLACALSVYLHDLDGAIELLGPYFAVLSDTSMVALARTDPDLVSLRDDQRFAAMLADADARLAADQDA